MKHQMHRYTGVKHLGFTPVYRGKALGLYPYRTSRRYRYHRHPCRDTAPCSAAGA